MDRYDIDYISTVKRLSYNINPDDIAAAALYAAYGELKEIPSEESHETSHSFKNNMVRLFMTIGKKDNIKVMDIVKSIASEANIPYSKIGNIRVLDKFSFIEIPEALADRVIQSVDHILMKGRKVKIEKARTR